MTSSIVDPFQFFNETFKISDSSIVLNLPSTLISTRSLSNPAMTTCFVQNGQTDTFITYTCVIDTFINLAVVTCTSLAFHYVWTNCSEHILSIRIQALLNISPLLDVRWMQLNRTRQHEKSFFISIYPFGGRNDLLLVLTDTQEIYLQWSQIKD